MKNTTDRCWTKPELKTVGTLRDVAGQGVTGSQSNGGGGGNGFS